MDPQNQTEKLEKLIRGSLAFSESEKKQLLEKASQLNAGETDRAIETFEWEKNQWEALKERGERDLGYIKNFVTKSQKEIGVMTRDMAHEIERKEDKKAVSEAESILKTI